MLALNLLLLAFVVRPAAARLEKAQTAQGELKRQNADALLFQKQKKAIAGIATGIPSQKDVPLLIKEIVQTARRRNLTVGAINSDIPTAGRAGVALLTFTVPVTGAYPDIKRFIYDIETTDRFVGVQGLDLKADKNAVKLEMKLLTYIKGE